MEKTIHKKWFLILNPTSGNFKVKNKIDHLKDQFKKNDISIEFAITKYKKHDFELTQDALKKGFRKFICIGGDGTLHYVVNGIMQQNKVATHTIKIAVMPVGTGNDWVKTYGIPKNIKKVISIIKNEKTIEQDIGKIKIEGIQQPFYFNNIAGIGFDGLVVKNHHKFKKIGSISYLLSTLFSYNKYKDNTIEIEFNKQKFTTSLFLLSVGICKYSGGGMQLTNYNDHQNGYFDITIIKEIDFNTILKSISKVFKGNIVNIKEFNFYKTNSLSINYKGYKPYIQADGELLGKGNCTVNIINNALQFVIS
ncbi:MAG: diacylglycerol kinase family protein [Bacteroidota bacterium]